MSFYHGSDTEVLLNGRDISAYLNSAEVSVAVDPGDTSAFKSSWKSYIAGLAEGTAELGGMYDTTVITDLEALLGDDPAAVLTIGPGNSGAAGDPARLLKIATTAHKESAPVGGVVAFSWSVMADGGVDFGHYLQPLAAITVDANGTSLDGGAPTTTGAVAHLHVTSVSASDTLDVTIEDSADNNTWATIGTFAQKSAAGAERLVIAGTIRRYVRAVLNVTGAGVSITAAVAFART